MHLANEQGERCRNCGTLGVNCRAPRGRACCARCNHYATVKRLPLDVSAGPQLQRYSVADWSTLVLSAVVFAFAAAAIVSMVLRHG